MDNLKRAVIFLFVLLFFASFVSAQDIKGVETEIYSKLRDKRCQVPLDKCNCPDAREMKAYIDALLETRITKDEIFYKVAKKFSLNMVLDAQIKQELEKRIMAEAGPSFGRLALEPDFFDFGKVSKKQGKISKVFKLYNRGKADLVLNNIRVSCGCVSAALKNRKDKSPDFGVSGSPAGWQEIIKPQKSAELSVTLDLLHSSMGLGKQAREVFVASNDPLYPQAALKIEIEITD